MEKLGKTRFRFFIEILSDTGSFTNTFSGSCSETATCLSELRETIPETAMADRSVAMMMNSRLFPVLMAAQDKRKIKPI